VLYIYFNEVDRQSQTASTILRKLLKQVVEQFDTVPAQISQMYESSVTTGSTPDRNTLSQNLKTCLNRFETVYILFDAIDECGDRQPKIISLIQDLLTLSSVKIFLTSRDSEPQRLPSPPVLAHLTVKARDPDIRIFLSATLETDTGLSQELKNEIIEVISQKAEGM